ncbi:MAG: hypothetical protein JXD22_04595, partial [Sedimentisphaerales bacterium]|nr:hypothetical protein [Sedimentisphaerales bacterium]
QKSEIRSQRSEVRDQKSEIRRVKIEDKMSARGRGGKKFWILDSRRARARRGRLDGRKMNPQIDADQCGDIKGAALRWLIE